MDPHDISKAPSQREQYAALLSWLVFIGQALETSVAVFMRRGFGQRYFGGQAALVLLLVPLWTLVWPEDDPRPLLWFLPAYLMGLAWARFDGVRRRRRGERPHSYYSGRPSLLNGPIFQRWLSEPTAKATVEPLFVGLVGAGVMQLNQPLGSYLLVAAAGQWIAVAMAQLYEQQRLTDARDAYLEQQHFAQQFRERDRF